MSGDSPEKGTRRRFWVRVAAFGVAAVLAFGVGILLRQIGADEERRPSGLSAAAGIEAKLADQPHEAASLALAAAGEDLSTEEELAMIEIAIDGRGLERVIETGEEVNAALALEAHLVTAGSGGSVQVWRRADGALLGETRVADPLVALADTEVSSPFLAALDGRGAVHLVEVADPARPRVLPLGHRLAAGEEPLAVALSQDTEEVVALGAGGELVRVDQTTASLVSRTSLRDFRGPLPWEKGEALRLTTAKFVSEPYDSEEALLVAMADGSVAELDLSRGQGRTVLPPDLAPGRILDLDRKSYEIELAVGGSGGYLTADEDEYGEPEPQLGPPVPAIAIDPEGDLWRGESGGVEVPETGGRPLSGPPVRGFDSGYHGVAALNSGDRASILGPAGVGLSLAETETTPVVSFDPDDRLLIASGYDANHIEEIRAVRPQPRLPGDEYQEDEVLQTYRPDPEWWPEAEEPDALYVNDVAGDGEHVVAVGQDPEGEAAVMVWDAKSGEPLRHLTLGTAGLQTELPSIATDVLLLSGRNEIAVYSAIQELIAIWSTETWELRDSVPVGPVGNVSVTPDESTIVTVGLAANPEFEPESDEPVALGFVDVEEAGLDHELQLPGALEAAVSPDGTTLAVAHADGFLRFRSADGRREEGEPVEIRGMAEALAWRPDGDLLAVALGEGEVILVDPRSGEATESLPVEVSALAHGLSWSEDGSMLATLGAEPEEEGEGYDPGQAAIWTLDPASLERRMCELAACTSSPANGDGTAGLLGDASQLAGLDLVFGREGEVLAADIEGNTARIGQLEKDPIPPAAYDWSDRGDLAWSAPGRVSVLATGAERPRTWPCACRGVAWDGEQVLSLKLDGSALVRIDPEGREPSASSVTGLPSFDPALLGVVGDRPVVAAYKREPDRATPSSLYRIEPDGGATFIDDAEGAIYTPWPSSSADKLAFAAGLSSGACYSTIDVGVVTATAGGGTGLRVPTPPLGEEMAVVRSVQVAADGSVGATIGPIGCDEEGMSAEREPLSERYLLDGDRWESTGVDGYDVQETTGGIAEVRRSDERYTPGALVLEAGGERRRLAAWIEWLVVRP